MLITTGVGPGITSLVISALQAVAITILRPERLSVGEDSCVHLETRDDLPRFGTIIAVDSNAIPEHLERLLKIADRVKVWRARRR